MNQTVRDVTKTEPDRQIQSQTNRKEINCHHHHRPIPLLSFIAWHMSADHMAVQRGSPVVGDIQAGQDTQAGERDSRRQGRGQGQKSDA